MDEKKRLQGIDKRYIWHPFTQMKEWERGEPLIIAEGSGCRVTDLDGKSYIDGVSSLWVNIHGHRRREIDEAIKAQVDRISHTTLLGLGNVPSIELAEKLAGFIRRSLGCSAVPPSPSPLPPGAREPILSVDRSVQFVSPPLRGGDEGEGGSTRNCPTKIFYSDNGSTSVEVALKMAFQYWAHKGEKGRNCFLALNHAYHGDTLGAVSVGGVAVFHDAFRPLLFHTFRAPAPFCYRCELGLRREGCKMECLGKMEETLREHHAEIAGVIIEPLVQAAGGMIIWPEGYLGSVRELCSRYGVLLIADEVATGFGRTGRMFACEHEQVVPDILCLSKGITGGYLPLAVTVATDEIYNAFLGEFRDLRTFFHGHSYTGNPLGCAAALACLGIFERDQTMQRIQSAITLLAGRMAEIGRLDHVGDARGKGLMAGIELVKDKATKEPYPWEDRMGWRVAEYAREHGVIIRPLGNVIVVMPPLAISEEELGLMMDVIRDGIAEVA